jgi:hypothetical protein
MDEQDRKEQQQQHEFDRMTRLHDIDQRQAQGAHDRNAGLHTSLNEAAMKGADAALRAALLINGGAAVSVLAFVGGLASQNRIELEQLKDVANSLALFAFGVVAAVAGLALAYFTNLSAASYVGSRQHDLKRPFVGPGDAKILWLKSALHAAAAMAFVLSLVLFIYGMFEVKNAVLNFKVPPGLAV